MIREVAAHHLPLPLAPPSLPVSLGSASRAGWSCRPAPWPAASSSASRRTAPPAAAAFRQDTSGFSNNDFATLTAALSVTAGDWLLLRLNFTSPSWNTILANSRGRLSLEVVETQ